MVTCNSFNNNVECALSLTNDYNIKLMIISLVFMLAIAMLVYSKYLSKTQDDDMHNMVKYYMFKYVPPVYIIFSPMTLLLLRHDIDFGMFLVIFSGFGGVVVSGVLLLAFSLVPRAMFNVMGQKEQDIWRTNMKHEKTERKYG